MTRLTSHHATRDGDTQISEFKFVCKTCHASGLAWGAHGAHRRLFSAGMRLHSCRQPVRATCRCEGFGDFTIPIEFYDPTEYRPWEQ